MKTLTTPIETEEMIDRSPDADPSREGAVGVSLLRLRLCESDREYVVRVEVPGVARGDLSIVCGDRRVTITGERRRAAVEGERTLSDDSVYGPFARTIETPQGFHGDRVRACSIDGVLEVHLPKVRVPTAKSPAATVS